MNLAWMDKHTLTYVQRMLRRLRMCWDILTTGWCECEIWSLDTAIADNVVPRLLKFSEISTGRPIDFKDGREWKRCLKRMAWAFSRKDRPLTPFLKNRERRGLLEFAIYFNHLWD